MLIPMTVSSIKGLYLPIVYSITTGLPVAIIAFLLAFSVARIGVFYNMIRIFQVWFNRIIAVIFIITGAYYIYLFLLQHFFNG
jgi:threonine/homoserine/homoserine lactone efflux protein